MYWKKYIFRKTLTGVAPFTDDFISVLWQEKSTGNNVLVTSYQNVKGFVTGFTNKDDTRHPVKQTSAPPQYKGKYIYVFCKRNYGKKIT